MLTSAVAGLCYSQVTSNIKLTKTISYVILCQDWVQKWGSYIQANKHLDE